MKGTEYTIRILLALLMAAFPVKAWSQTQSANYVMTRVMQDAGGSSSVSSVAYYDGLGRPTMSVDCSVSPLGPVAQLTEYSGLGEIAREWLPVPFTGLGLISPGSYAGRACIHYDDTHPYTETKRDALGRTVEEWGPGQKWRAAARRVCTEHGTNAANSVRRYTATASSSAPQQHGYYGAGALHREMVTDEDGRTAEVFTDLTGSTVLERRAGNNDTYFVYDSIGLLRFVLQPEYQNNPDASLYAFSYYYDALGNLTEAASPGCAPTYTWYDKGRRVAFMQDASLRERGRMRFFLYDAAGRHVLTGTCASLTPPATYSGTAAYSGTSASVTFAGYMRSDNVAMTDVRIERADYYDDYRFIGFIGQRMPGCDTTQLSHTPASWSRGMATGSLQYASDGQPLVSASYYDAKGNIVYTAETGLDGAVYTAATTYDFTGRPLSAVETSKVGGVTSTYTSSNTYHRGSGTLTSTTAALTAGGVTKQGLAGAYTYDGTGRLVSVRRGPGLGDLAYAMNIRGWTTSIDGPGFSETLHYTDGAGTPMYSSLISSQEWKCGDTRSRRYAYTYDALGRMTKASYWEAQGSIVMNNRYDEEVTEYTANGAIKKLKRWGARTAALTTGIIDNLTIELTGNRLKKVTDAAAAVNIAGTMDFRDGASLAQEYYYNDDGSLIADANKGISLIEYDDCGYPRLVQFADGSQTRYVYTPGGRKLRQKHITAVDGITVPLLQSVELTPEGITAADSTDYAGRFIYDDAALSMCQYKGGYFGKSSPSSSTWLMYYYTCDHLGNNRTVVTETGTVLQALNYYPFGSVFLPNINGNSVQPYKYNGKELDRMHGLNLYDYGFRFYDPTLGIWTSVDQKAEEFYDSSTYAFCGNNPVNHIDQDGMFWDVVWDVANVIYDVGAAVYNHVEGNHNQAKEHWGDAAFDVVAAVIPGLPAGATKALKTASKVDDATKAVKATKATNPSKAEKTYQTYTKTHKTRKNDVYSGRTSGTDDPRLNVKNRDKNHHKNKEGYGEAVLDKTSENADAIRGREQELIEIHGGAQSQGGTSGNKINSISKRNPKKEHYEQQRRKEFGN